VFSCLGRRSLPARASRGQRGGPAARAGPRSAPARTPERTLSGKRTSDEGLSGLARRCGCPDSWATTNPWAERYTGRQIHRLVAWVLFSAAAGTTGSVRGWLRCSSTVGRPRGVPTVSGSRTDPRPDWFRRPAARTVREHRRYPRRTASPPSGHDEASQRAPGGVLRGRLPRGSLCSAPSRGRSSAGVVQELAVHVSEPSPSARRLVVEGASGGPDSTRTLLADRARTSISAVCCAIVLLRAPSVEVEARCGATRQPHRSARCPARRASGQTASPLGRAIRRPATRRRARTALRPPAPSARACRP
jgi:hypothetical protein